MKNTTKFDKEIVQVTAGMAALIYSVGLLLYWMGSLDTTAWAAAL